MDGRFAATGNIILSVVQTNNPPTAILTSPINGSAFPAGGTVAFSGTTNTFTTTGGSAAVSLTSNTGATVNFSNGGLAISSGAGSAFTASGGGTVSVASGANPNTLVTTSGTPLNVQNVTLGATGLNFTSIATSGSATNGIVLSNTGTGPLTVTGGGASDAANTTKGRTTAKSGGGTLTLGAGGTITGTTGTAVSLATTGPVTLQNMVIKSSLADGVNASSSTALTLDNTQVTTNTGFGVRTSSVASPTLQHMDITSNATLVDTTRYNAALLEVSGTATVQNSAFATSNNALLRLINLTANGTANVSNSGFTSSSISVGVEAFARNTGGLALTVQTGSFTNTRSGVTFLSSSSAASSFTVSSNNLQFSGINSAYGVSIVRDTGGAGLFTGTISSNTVGTGGVTNSGPWAGNAVDVTTRGNGGTIQVTITNNTIRQFGTHGIALTSGAAPVGHTLETKIQGNNIANGEPTSLDGINVVPGTTPNTDRITACLNIGGTTGAQQNTVTNAVRQAIRVRPIGGIAPNGPPPTAIRLQNWDGSTAPATYLANQNPAATSAAAGGFANTGFTNSGSGATTLVGTCTTP